MVARGDNRRIVRVGETIKAEISKLLVREASDPELSWATITSVSVSPDLRQARVYFAAAGAADEKQVQEKLTRATPFLQRELGSRLTTKYTPKIAFFKDESFDSAMRIDELIDEVKNEKNGDTKEETEPRTLDRLISEADNILVATHKNPDGDAIGSLLGLSGILQLMGKAHVTYCPDGIPHTLAFLPGAQDITRALEPDAEFDVTILLDTADETLFPSDFPEPQGRGTFVVIDHHAAHKEMGDLVIRREVSAVGELLFDLSRELVWPIDRDVAECFYTSIVADTGSFRYSSTTPDTLRVAAELLFEGARPWVVATNLFESFTPSRQQLLAKVLGTLEISEDGSFAQMYSTPKMLEEAGAVRADLDGMINFGRSIVGVEMAAMFRIEKEGNIKVSFRSKGRIDVSALAGQFGGGGHKNAAGCTIRDISLEDARKKVMEAAAGLKGSSDDEDPLT